MFGHEDGFEHILLDDDGWILRTSFKGLDDLPRAQLRVVEFWISVLPSIDPGGFNEDFNTLVEFLRAEENRLLVALCKLQ